MAKKLSSHGFSLVWTVAVVLVLASIALVGWQVSRKNSKAANSTGNQNGVSQNERQTANQGPAAQVDPTEGGKYLYIKEWDVRVVLPANLQGKTTYQLTEPAPDQDGNVLQSAKILVSTRALAPNECAVIADTSVGVAINTASQYIRSERSKPFNASRYRWTFRSDILTTKDHAFHLNYADSVCAGSANEATLSSLNQALVDLKTTKD